MLISERHRRLIDYLNDNGFATVHELSEKLYSSLSTVRRDLAILEDEGVLKRTWGGAMIVTGTNRDTPSIVRRNLNISEKRKIANLAMKYIKNSSTIFLDSSSTCTQLATKLNVFSDLTVVTNGLDTLNTLRSEANMRIISSGGSLRANFEFTGQAAIDTISRYHADLFFFSCCGVSTTGITEKDEYNAAVKQQFFRYSKKRILLCDSSKFDLSFFHNAFSLKDIDLVITDKAPTNPQIKKTLGDSLIY